MPARRAPYADRPTVGARGLRTQQRILDAALRVFGENGYDRSTLEKIAARAGCSRVSIYQYFEGKDDVFRQLAGQVARQLRAAVEALEPVTPDAAGLAALASWIGRYAEVFARYEPVFRAFAAAAESDSTLAGGAESTTQRNLALFVSKLDRLPLPARPLDALASLVLATVTRTLDIAAMLRAATPGYERERVEPALAAALHRALFGADPAVNAPPADAHRRVAALRFGPGMAALFERARTIGEEAGRPGRRTLAAMLRAGPDVVAAGGYQGTRVDQIVAAAGVSHGAFYNYFDNVEDFVRTVAAGAVDELSAALAEAPDATDRAALRRWLREYNRVHVAKGALTRVWAEAVEDGLRADRAAVLDWARRRLARLLAGRGFGDADVDAVVLLAALEAFGAAPRTGAELDAAVLFVERGLFGTREPG